MVKKEREERDSDQQWEDSTFILFIKINEEGNEEDDNEKEMKSEQYGETRQ